MMTEKMALNLVRHYIDGWKQNDLAMILSCLAENCVVIESHGPTYRGLADIECWFKFWLAANSEVKKWDILSFTFCEKTQTAFVEWDFVCISNAIGYALPGISLIQFTEQKIVFIHEYRMTQPAYEWKKDRLKSE